MVSVGEGWNAPARISAVSRARSLSLCQISATDDSKFSGEEPGHPLHLLATLGGKWPVRVDRLVHGSSMLDEIKAHDVLHIPAEGTPRCAGEGAIQVESKSL